CHEQEPHGHGSNVAQEAEPCERYEGRRRVDGLRERPGDSRVAVGYETVSDGLCRMKDACNEIAPNPVVADDSGDFGQGKREQDPPTEHDEHDARPGRPGSCYGGESHPLRGASARVFTRWRPVRGPRPPCADCSERSRLATQT